MWQRWLYNKWLNHKWQRWLLTIQAEIALQNQIWLISSDVGFARIAFLLTLKLQNFLVLTRELLIRDEIIQRQTQIFTYLRSK